MKSKISKPDQAYVEANPGLSPEQIVEDTEGRLTLRQAKAALKKLAPVPEAVPAALKKFAPMPEAVTDHAPEEAPKPQKVGRFAVKNGSVVMTEAQAMIGDGVKKAGNKLYDKKFPGCSFDPSGPSVPPKKDN